MAHFGLICPPVSGHVDPFAALGRNLMLRGHRATMFQVSDLEAKAQSEGLNFCSLGRDHFPPGTLAQTVAEMSRLRGIASLRHAVESECRVSDVILQYGPESVMRAGVDALLVDQNEPAGASVAEYLGLPFVSVCTSLPLNREPLVPPPFVGWSYTGTLLSRLRNGSAHAVADRLIAPIQKTLNTRREQWKLPLLKTPDDSFSRVAQIAQMTREFDFPRLRLPSAFHYVGPLFDSHSSRVPFPFEKLDGRPLIYGSLGTLQRGDHEFFRIMADACTGLDAQLVISVGKSGSGSLPKLPGDPVVVNYAPQIDLLSRAALTITHAGMNTTQQSLHFGVPMVATPLTHDQPAIASRLSRSGAGIVIPPASLTRDRLRSAIQSVLEEDSSYKQAADFSSEASRQAGGLRRAVEVLEHSLGLPAPVADLPESESLVASRD